MPDQAQSVKAFSISCNNNRLPTFSSTDTFLPNCETLYVPTCICKFPLKIYSLKDIQNKKVTSVFYCYRYAFTSKLIKTQQLHIIWKTEAVFQLFYYSIFDALFCYLVE